jgi:hypothetical protein
MEQDTTFLANTKEKRRIKMNFRKRLIRGLKIVIPVAFMVALTITLVAGPAGAINQLPAWSGSSGVLNDPELPPPTPIQIPEMINYQGYLTDDEGNPINGNLEMTFSVYEFDTGSSPLWTETHSSVTVTDGLFNVLLGSINPINASHLTGRNSYLGIKVGSDPEMTPRQQIVSVAYAHRCHIADTLDAWDSSAFVMVTGGTMTGDLYIDGKIGIGTTTPGDFKLNVQGGSNNGIYVSGNSTGIYAGGSYAGLHGESSTGAGVRGWSDSQMGVEGRNSDSNNYGQLGTNAYGVYGSAPSSFGRGVYGEGSWCGVYGEHNTSGNYGQLGTDDEGVYGEHSISNNYGRLGTSNEGVFGFSSSGIGVIGHSTSGRGVFGGCDEGYGVYGYSKEKTGVNGWGSEIGTRGSSENGTGVHGWSTNGTGVHGYGGTYDFYADGPGTNYGAFTGAHEVKLADGFMENIKSGLIVSTTGDTYIRIEEGQTSFSSTLPTVQLADTPNDKTVFGVLIKESPLPEDHWYEVNEGERFGIVNALGEGRVWVTNINGDIENGDYITTSAIAGYGQKQDDDLLHSYTLGKATETIDWSQVTETIQFNGQIYKVYAIAVVYTSG